jgi:hypothetical protein
LSHPNPNHPTPPTKPQPNPTEPYRPNPPARAHPADRGAPAVHPGQPGPAVRRRRAHELQGLGGVQEAADQAVGAQVPQDRAVGFEVAGFDGWGFKLEALKPLHIPLDPSPRHSQLTEPQPNAHQPNPTDRSKGKLEVVPTKAMGSKEDLSVAYSPGVAEPCLSIQHNPARAYDYTAKGHLVGGCRCSRSWRSGELLGLGESWLVGTWSVHQPTAPNQPTNRSQPTAPNQRRHHQRHRRPGPGQHRPPRRQARYGGQGGALQEVCRPGRL